MVKDMSVQNIVYIKYPMALEYGICAIHCCSSGVFGLS